MGCHPRLCAASFALLNNPKFDPFVHDAVHLVELLLGGCGVFFFKDSSNLRRVVRMVDLKVRLRVRLFAFWSSRFSAVGRFVLAAFSFGFS